MIDCFYLSRSTGGDVDGKMIEEINVPSFSFIS